MSMSRDRRRAPWIAGLVAGALSAGAWQLAGFGASRAQEATTRGEAAVAGDVDADVLGAGAGHGDGDAAAAVAGPRPRRPAAAPADRWVAVPDRYLRRWDPITLFFPAAAGPAAGGPLDDPSSVVDLQPAHEGAWRWLDARTLQFRPAVPWPPLERVVVRAAPGRAGDAKAPPLLLSTLLEAPLEVRPEPGATGLESLTEVALTFADPVPAAALARAAVLEVRPLPGHGGPEAGGAARFLRPEDFEVKAIERARAGERATSVLALHRPIPAGQRVTLRLRLALDDAAGADRPFWEASFATAEPFRVVRFGCREAQLPAVAGGVVYDDEQALRCEAADPALVVEFSADVALGPAEARNLVRVSPAIPALEARLSGRRLELRGEFARDTAYRVTLQPTALADRLARPLDLRGPNTLLLAFAPASSFLRLAKGEGIVERRGPQAIPLVGRGDDRLDLRLHAIDPLDRGLWPFGERPLEVDESERPPGPGEEAPPWSLAERDPEPAERARRVLGLGAPLLSTLVDLPLRRAGGSASFGLDLRSLLADTAGRARAGTYLVGARRLGAGTTRSWMRLQVTDLALTTLEEPLRTVFAVTSLETARPIAGATVEVEGVRHGAAERPEWVSLFRGRTDAQGLAVWAAPGDAPRGWQEVRRIAVVTADDALVLDARRPPDAFRENRWAESHETWLQWTQESLAGRAPEAEWVAHLFAERPIHRPEEVVHLKGYARRREAGRLRPVEEELLLVVEGPGDLVWRYTVTPDAWGAIYHRFEEPDLPTGTYRARLERAEDQSVLAGTATFRKDAYRLPRFEVRLDGPERAALDRPFEVKLAATYYAGGRVSARPVEWRVTQFPHLWRPAGMPGFVFASDARFARDRRFESTPMLERTDATDADGGARLQLDPTIEPTVEARSYAVEATVTDVDDQTVTAVRSILAVPPFLLGVAQPRYLEAVRGAPRVARPAVVVLGPDEKPLAGQEVTVRLLRRQWHSHLRAADFSDGVARYVTEVVEEKVSERSFASAARPTTLEFPLEAAGVYVLEIESHDRRGRAQTLSVDFFAAGEEPVVWSKPATAVFRMVPDKERYQPGETARLVLESPFQSGEALVAVETPDGNRYSWLPVRGGQATFTLPIEASWTPRLPVHVLLQRGRLPGSGPRPGNATDLGRPATFGSTAWLEVEPRAYRADLRLEHPARARPGQTIEVEVRLADPEGRPLAGQVTLWLVDQAVLALAREARLDPVPSFLADVRSRFAARDTRSLVFGDLPFAELPGGDEGEASMGLLDRQTVRRNFQAVPFYEPSIEVGPSGVVRVPVTLGDDLTDFAVRAKAVAGEHRFAHATGRIEVRQPVLVQPALPRFVRAGDRFEAGLVARILDGTGGPGQGEIRAEGLEIAGPSRLDFDWSATEARRIGFEVRVPSPRLDAAGGLATTEVVLRLGAERSGDRAGDAIEARLPLRDDRDRLRRSMRATLEPGGSLDLAGPEEAVRPGSLRRKVLVSGAEGMVELASGLDFLVAYPYGCTEQRLAAARSRLALRRFRALFDLESAAGGADRSLDRAVADTLAWLATVQRPNGLFAFWPGGRGSVSLTAWAVEFAVEARAGGFALDAAVEERALRALEQALRSDYAELLEGEAWAERTFALRALASAGRFDPAYGNELARRAQFLDLENLAGVLVAFDRAGQSAAPALEPLEADLWRSIRTRLHAGAEIYAGLDDRPREPSGLLLASEARTAAELLRALGRRAGAGEEARRLAILRRGLLALEGGEGWGSTQASAAAILALAPDLEGGLPANRVAPAGGETVALEGAGAGPGGRAAIEVAPTGAWSSTAPGPLRLHRPVRAPGAAAFDVRVETSWVPAAEGSTAAARREGFVVSRGLERWARAADGAGAEGAGREVADRTTLEEPGTTLRFEVGDVIEERIQVVNPEDRHYVAVDVPLAAGFEPLDPHLATAPPEARPSQPLTVAPTYAEYLDDRVVFYYDTLPKGTYDFAFRVRAQVPGVFQQPGAKAEMMYDGAVVGSSPGARVEIRRAAPAPGTTPTTAPTPTPTP